MSTRVAVTTILFLVSLFVPLSVSLHAERPVSNPALQQKHWMPVTSHSPESTSKATLVGATERERVIKVEMPGVALSQVAADDGLMYTQLDVPGGGIHAAKPGQPAMPFKGTFVEIPYGVDARVELLDESWIALGAGHRVFPMQPPSVDDGRPLPPFTIDSAAYATDAFYPPHAIEMSEPAMIRGRRVVFVKVSPLQYNPATTELRSLRSMDFRVVLSGEIDLAGAERRARLSNDSTEAFSRHAILSAEPTVSTPNQGVAARAIGNAADYLIIARDDLIEGVEPLAEWKQKKGFFTRVVKVSDAGFTAANIKNYIQAAYDTWDPAPYYVLLVGDSPDVPPYPKFGHGSYDEIPFYLWYSDHPYSCVDGADYFPDLMVGRISVTNAAECAAVVHKILAYDKTPLIGDWYDDFLTAAFFQDNPVENEEPEPPTPPNGIDDKYYIEISAFIKDFLISQGMTAHTAWCPTSSEPVLRYRLGNYPNRPPYPDPIPNSVRDLWTSANDAKLDIIEAVNNGVGLVIHRDHGGQGAWGNPPFQVTHANGLINDEKTPVVYGIECLSGQFYWNNIALVEAWQRNVSGGAVGVIGSVEVSWTPYNEVLLHGIIDSHFPGYNPDYGDNTYPNSWRPAEALAYGKYYLMSSYGVNFDGIENHFDMFHWFGDPEMKLRTENPEPVDLELYVFGDGTGGIELHVKATKNGLPIPGIEVAFAPPYPSKAPLFRTSTTAHGQTSFVGLNLSSMQNYTLTATETNGIPFEATWNINELGACCIDAAAPSCTDGVSMVACMNNLQLMGVSGRWTPGLCANMGVACGAGACCHGDGDCDETSFGACNQSGDNWLGYGSSCENCCVVDCPAGSTAELEACGLNTNPGCDGSPQAFESLACGATVCGKLWANGANHDVDWYQLTVATDQSLQLSFSGEIPATIGIMQPTVWGLPGCGNLVGWAAAEGTAFACESVTAGPICLPAGTYYIRVEADIDAGHACHPVGFGNEYVLATQCSVCTVATGACCDDRVGVCASGVAEVNCQEYGQRFIAGGGCGDFDPPCGEPWGACCNDISFLCTEDTFQVDCPATGRFEQYPGNCRSFEPNCEYQACCLPDDTCEVMTPAACLTLDGTPQGADTACLGEVSCCFVSQPCQNLDANCCLMAGGFLSAFAPPSAGDDTCQTATGPGSGTPCSSNANCTISGEVCGLKSRYVSITPTNATVAGTSTSIQVEIVSMPQFPTMVGDIYYAGPEQSILNAPLAALRGAPLQCTPTPNAQVWTSGVLHLFGQAVVPGSTYNVRMCDENGSNCSDPLLVATGKWGDVIRGFGGGSQPNFGDVSAIVAKFGNVASAPNTARTDIVGPQAPGTPNTPNQGTNFADVSNDVSAFSGFAYPYTVSACP